MCRLIFCNVRFRLIQDQVEASAQGRKLATQFMAQIGEDTPELSGIDEKAIASAGA
jgi:hypothetical protein